METPKKIKSYTIEKAGFLPGYVPAFRVVIVVTDSEGISVVEKSQQLVFGEAQAKVEDLMAEELGI